MENIKMSIIIPVYNVEEYIYETINSIISQDYKNLEIIIINDGSTDNTKRICGKFINKDKRIIFIDKYNTGLSDCRNIGIESCTGDYIMFVDGDDYLEKNCISKLVSRIRDKNDIYICSYKRHYINGSSFIFDRYSRLDIDSVCDGKTILKSMYHNNFYECSVWANVYSRQFIKKNDLYFNKSLKRHEDEEWFLKLLINAEKCEILDVLIYNTRAGRVNSLSNTLDYKNEIYKIKVSDNILKYCENYKINDVALMKRINLAMVSFYVNSIIISHKYNNFEKNEILLYAKENKYILLKACSFKQKIGKILILLFGFNIGSKILYKTKKIRVFKL